MGRLWAVVVEASDGEWLRVCGTGLTLDGAQGPENIDNTTPLV